MPSPEAPSLANSERRIDGIDLLRGLAIFFVLIDHVSIRLAGAKVPYRAFLPPQLAHFLFGNGELGVQMFFAVSGFLITSISLRRWSPLSRIKVGQFYILRFARIAPLFLLLLAVLCGLHFAHIHNYVVTARTGGLGRALLAALTFRINVLDARTWYLPGNWDILWSLSSQVGHDTRRNELSAFLNLSDDTEVAVVYQGLPTTMSVSQLLESPNIAHHIFIKRYVPTEYISHVPLSRRVMVGDPFNRQPRNADYPEQEFFTDMNTVDGNPDRVDFGDFSLWEITTRTRAGRPMPSLFTTSTSTVTPAELISVILFQIELTPPQTHLEK